MNRRFAKIILFCVLLFFVTTGCQKPQAIEENTQEKNTVSKVEDNIGEEGEGPDSDGMDQQNGDSSIKSDEELAPAETDSAKEPITEYYSEKQNITTSNDSKTNNSTTQSVNKDVHIHNFIEQSHTISHSEEGRYETKVIREAYDEDVYAWRTFCNNCGEDLTDLGAEGITIHCTILCESGYHNDYVIVDTIRRDAVTEEKWVVDIPCCTETIISYRCECGEIQEGATPYASREAFNLINQERAKLGLELAVWDSTCEKIARIRAREVLALGSLNESNAHEGFDKFQKVNRRLGECIAWGYTSAAGAVNGWMNSPGHKSTLMAENYTKIAIMVCGNRWVAVNSR